MSSCSRRLAILSLAALGACGFQPVYGPGGGGLALRGAVEANEPNERNAFLYVAQIERRLGAPQAARYRLGYSLSLNFNATETAADGSVTRLTVDGRVDYTLVDQGTGATVASGFVEGFTGYSATASQLATETAQEDAAARLMVILADKTVTQLYALGLSDTP